MRTRIRFVPEWLKRLLTTPATELNRWQYATRFFLELCRQGAFQLRQDRAGQMAAALSFRTIFGLIPVIVIVALLFRAFGETNLFSNLINHVLEVIGVDQIAHSDKGMTLGEWARDSISQIDARLNAKSIGIAGVLVMSWAAIGLLTTIERSFNTICQAPAHRSLGRRIPLYWTTITIGPALLYMSFHFETRFVEMIRQTGMGDSTASCAGSVTSFIATWLFLLVLYKLMPHTRVHTAAVAVGSVVAATFWTGATGVFEAYISWSFNKENSAFAMLYGALGLIPLFMLWIYVLWLIVLYGLEITHMLQVVGGRMDGEMPVHTEMPPLTDPAAVVPVMQAIAESFAEGQAVSVEQIVDQTKINQRVVELLLSQLVKNGFVHCLDQDDAKTYSLARPPEKINTGEILEVAMNITFTRDLDKNRASNWLQSFHRAQLGSSVHTTLTKVCQTD